MGSSFGNIPWWVANWTTQLSSSSPCVFQSSALSPKFHFDGKRRFWYEVCVKKVGVLWVFVDISARSSRKQKSIYFFILTVMLSGSVLPIFVAWFCSCSRDKTLGISRFLRFFPLAQLVWYIPGKLVWACSCCTSNLAANYLFYLDLDAERWGERVCTLVLGRTFDMYTGTWIPLL